MSNGECPACGRQCEALFISKDGATHYRCPDCEINFRREPHDAAKPFPAPVAGDYEE